MSRVGTFDEWELVVTDDDAELVAEFHRHGVRPGQRVHVVVVNGDEQIAADEQLPPFFSSFAGPADLSERSSEILRAEFPGAR